MFAMDSKLSRKEIKSGRSTHDSTNTNNNKNDKGVIFKMFHELAPGTKILQGPSAQSNKMFGPSSRNKQSPASCIVAAVYDKMLLAPYWNKTDLEKILKIGDKLYRTSVTHIPLKKWQILKPNCVFPTFYIDQFKVTIFVGNEVIVGEHTQRNSQFSNLIVETIPNLLDEHYSVVLHFHEKDLSIWKNGDGYILFCPHDADSAGYPTQVNKGNSFVMYVDNIAKLSEHLASFIYGKFCIYSVKILKFSELSRTMSGLIAQMQNKEAEGQEREQINNSKSVETTKDKNIFIPSQNRDLLEMTNTFNLSTSSNYKTIVEGQGSLVHSNYEQDPEMILFDNLAAIIYLHIAKSFLWTNRTIADILALGVQLSDANFDIETHITGVLEVLAHGKSYKLNFEKVVFGLITSKDETIPTILKGIEYFFTKHDVGIIDGPQSVVIWKEKGAYFVFDAKERDALGRKWTKLLSKELGPAKKGGGACVIWYSDLTKLTERYISNVPLKHRSDPFRIIHVQLNELPDDDSDWGAWSFVKAGRWILQGDKSVCEFVSGKDANNRGKLLCLGCYTIAYIKIHPEEDWTEESLKNLLNDAMKFYTNSINIATQVREKPSLEKQRSAENIKSADITELSDIKNILTIEGQTVQLVIDKCVLSGKCPPNHTSNPPMPGLRGGIESFFNNYRYGLITVGDSVLPIWSDNEAYYFLDCYKKSNIGQAITQNCKPFGNITAARFTVLADMINVITSNAENLGCEKFCISRVECSAEGGDSVPLRNFDFLSHKAAILRQDDYHEGHSLFGSRADKQTLCNLITALCLTLLNESAEWSKIDLADIIRTGDRIYSKIIEEFDDCESSARTITWDDLHPEIGMNTFQFTREEQNGILEKSYEEQLVNQRSEKSLNENDNSFEGLKTRNELENEDHINIEEISATKTKDNNSEKEPDTLSVVLMKLEPAQFYTGILECDFFTVALWKQNGLYFVFDPKACDDRGYPSNRRIQHGIGQVKVRIAKEKESKLTEAILNNQESGTNVIEPELPENNLNSQENSNKLQDSRLSKDSQASKRSQFDSFVNNEASIDINSLPNDGSAYVAWFQTLEDFIEHLLSKVPSENRNETFKFHRLHFKKNLLEKKVAAFKSFEERDAEGFWLLRASISQDDVMFPNRTLQDISNSIIALAFTTISPSDEWTPTILNVLLKYGDRLYTKSKLLLKFDMKSKLQLDQIAKSFSIYKIKFDFFQKSENNTETINNPTQFEEINPVLVQSINKLGRSKNLTGAILELNDYYNVAIWRTSGIIFIFDPHQTDPDGKNTNNGVACLSRFANVNVLFKTFRHKFNNAKNAIRYKLYYIEVKTTESELAAVPMNTVENLRIPDDQSAFIKYGKRELTLLATNERKEDLSEVLTCLASVILSHLLHTECWTPMILNKVFSLAQNLSENSSNIKITVTTDKVELDLKGLIRCFTVDGTVCTLDLDEVIRGPITSTNAADVTLLNSLNLFLRNYCRSIVITSSYICAVWREQDKFYLFNAEKGKKPFVLGFQHQCDLYDWMIRNRPIEESSNWYEIVRVEIASILTRDVDKPTVSKKYKKRVNFEVLNEFQLKHNRMVRGPRADKTFRSLNSTQLDDLSNRQKAACIVAAGVCHLKDISKWKTEIFDTISRSALLLYMDSVAVRGSMLIDITDMEQHFQLQNIQFQVQALPLSQEYPSKDNIAKILANIFHKHEIAYIAKPDESMLAIRWKTKCYIFHPEKMAPDGNYVSACVVNLESFDALIKHLVGIIGGSSELVKFGAIKLVALE